VAPAIDPLFQPYYDQYGAQDSLRPAGQQRFSGPGKRPDGAVVRRARLEYWPGWPTPATRCWAAEWRHIYQRAKILFPTQQPFVNLEQVRYFAETDHGLTQPFLSFWLRYDGCHACWAAQSAIG
jgi:hypothetical protein